MTSPTLSYQPKAPHLNLITMGLVASICIFWGDTDIQSATILMGQIPEDLVGKGFCRI